MRRAILALGLLVCTARDAAATPEPRRRAEACLADPACAASEAERLFLEADAAGDPLLDCTRFLHGVGVKKDAVRARTCLERRAGRLTCDGGSPELDLAELAELRIDGIGGRRDLAGATRLLAGCYEDITVQTLRERASTVAANPATPPLDFCTSLGGTQVVMDACTWRARLRERDRTSLLAKSIAAGLDAPGKALLRTAMKAHDAYVHAAGMHVIAVYDGGSIRFVLGAQRERELEAERANDLGAFGGFVAPALGADDLARARSAHAKALADQATTGPAESPEAALAAKQVKEALAEAERAWGKYRDAELALHEHVFGAAQGKARVRDAITLRLLERRARTIPAPPP